jgi:hypothetical protein
MREVLVKPDASDACPSVTSRQWGPIRPPDADARETLKSAHLP